MLNTTEFEDNIDNLRSCFINLSGSQETEGETPDISVDRTKLFSINPVFSESIFALLFSPTTPVCFDSSGLLSEFMKKVFAGNSYGYDLLEVRSTGEETKKIDIKSLSDSQISASNIETETLAKEEII